LVSIYHNYVYKEIHFSSWKLFPVLFERNEVLCVEGCRGTSRALGQSMLVIRFTTLEDFLSSLILH